MPQIVCLCGSTRFYQAFQKANFTETMGGKIVLSVGFYPHAQGLAHGQETGVTPKQKDALDDLHKRKIDMADEILVLNVDGYVGNSTASEIRYAMKLGKPVRWLDPCKIPVIDGVCTEPTAAGRMWKVEASTLITHTVQADDGRQAVQVFRSMYPGMRVDAVRDFWTGQSADFDV